jgi:ATP-dependent Lhr-like helicase
MRADDLMAAVFPAQVQCQENATGPIEIPDHPLVRQTVDDCLFEAMDLVRLAEIIEKMERGEIRLHARDTTEPSPFSHEILNSKPYTFLDDAPLEERRARAVSLRRTLPEDQRDLGALDPEAIARVVLEAKPAPRDADELHDVLLSLVGAPIDPTWRAWLDDLVRDGRAATCDAKCGPLAFPVEHTRTIETLYPNRRISPPVTLPARMDGPRPSLEEASFAIVRGHAEVMGPVTAEMMSERLGIDGADVRIAVARLEGQGLALRGAYTAKDANEICDRRLLARIHRYTLDRLRSEIEPVSAQDFMRFLFERHHLSPKARMGGRAGLREAIQLLSGYELPASAWETEVLARRVAGYRPEWLDELCLTGEVVWARLSPRRSPIQVIGSTSRATPITLARREDLAWLLEGVRGATDGETPAMDRADATSVLETLKRRGALFLHDLATMTKLDKTALADALWDLVGRGMVTGDGFQPLRDLMASGKAAKRSGRATQGRWSLLEYGIEGASPADELADKVAGQLLHRYGIALRELYTRESFTVPWRDVARALRRREARGLVRGGLFVAGFIGEQYALPEAVDSLRRVRRRERTGEIVRMSAVDPLNLVGVILPEPVIKPARQLELTFIDGLPKMPPRAEEATVQAASGA